MHFLLIPTNVLNTILETIIFNSKQSFVFHLLCDTHSDKLTFQANYNNDYYASYTISISQLLFFDLLEFKPIILNYEQCLKLIQITKMFHSVSIGFANNFETNFLEVVVSHSNVKLILPIDNEIDHNPIIPPEENPNFQFIEIETELLKNIITLVHSSKFYTPIRIDSKKSVIIFGDEGSIQSIIKLPQTYNLIDSNIYIEPDSIISFLSNLKIKNIEIKVNKAIAFIIHSITEIGEIYYYRGHELDC